MIWMVQKALLRVKQKLVRIAIKLMNPPIPELLSGAGAVKKLPSVIKKEGVSHVLVVTDEVLMGLGVPNGLLTDLEKTGIQATVFDGVQPNPTIQNIEDGLKLYLDNRCDGIVAFGGGSPMDCAKGISLRQARPDKSVPELRGLAMIKNEVPPLYAIPTTAGTGSELTIGGIVMDPENHEKFGFGNKKLVPKWAVLDPELTVSLPPHVTAATGMDALTHAVEAYISRHANQYTDDYAEKAVIMIFDNLEKAYADGSDLAARNEMLMASYYAGLSFSRALVGYVHSIAHNMGGLYGLPHGLANAIILPHVLDYSRKDAQRKLARLAVVTAIGRQNESEETLSKRFIDHIREMNRRMDIPDKIPEIQEKDIPLIVRRTLAETNIAYAPPTMMSPKQCAVQVRLLMA